MKHLIARIKCLFGYHKEFLSLIAGQTYYIAADLKCVHCNHKRPAVEQQGEKE